MAFTDLELLARLIKCEAGGEGENGMKAVAGVIMNRVNDTQGEYGRVSQGGNVHNIAYQPRQFECVTQNSSQNRGQNIYNMSPEPIHYDIASWAIAGNRLTTIENALWFFNPYSPDCPTNFPSAVGYYVGRVGEHCFFGPTSAYNMT